MVERLSDGSTAADRLRQIADRLEQLASEARAGAEEELAPAPVRGPRRRRTDHAAVAEGARRLHEEADRAVAEAARVLDRSVEAAGARILDVEREARERILATTEAACQRIEAVDRAQERVAEALARITPPGG